jgi:dCMP deaminase
MKRKSSPRKEWDQYFLDVAKLLATRATCDRLHVGAVIVKDHRILVTGYNGSSPKAPHCDEVGHLIVNDHCKRTTHAEINAIAQAAANGIALRDSHIYITHAPCTECFRMILACGINRITFSELYTLTQKHIDLYNEIAGYRTIQFEEETEKYFNWNLDINSKVWYKA